MSKTVIYFSLILREREEKKNQIFRTSEMGDKTTKMRIAQDMKRFREKYSHPVQVRVFNVLKHWIDQHFYDFGSDHDLQHKLNMFLDSIHGKSMKKWVECISKIVQRRVRKTFFKADIPQPSFWKKRTERGAIQWKIQCLTNMCPLTLAWLPFGAHSCTAHQMKIFAQEFEPDSYFCDWTCVHLITSWHQ